MTDWQPIETAPDRELVLLWMPLRDTEGSDITVWTGALYREDDCGEEFETPHWSIPEVYGKGVSWTTDAFAPTHWMPLPPAPQNEV